MEMMFQTGAVELWRGAEGFANTPHSHEDWVQLTLPVQGSCEFIQDGRAWGLKPGSGLVQPPRALHHFRLEKGASVIILKCREDAVAAPAASSGHPYENMAKSFDAEALSRRFRIWSGQLMKAQLAGESDVRGTEREIMAYINGILSAAPGPEARQEQPGAGLAGFPLLAPESGSACAGIAPGASSGSAVPTAASPCMQKVVDFMKEGYAGRITIEELASIACLSRFHFIRSFRAETGLTPYQYLLRLRIEEAKDRLSRSSDSVSHISAELGFSSPSQFYRSFQKLAGTTPQAYRSRW